MNENIVDILIYLYEHYMDSGQPVLSSQAELHEMLLQAGFPEREIGKAFLWMEELTSRQGLQDYQAHTEQSLRIFTDEEQNHLDTDCQGLLLFLEQNDILDQASRELVIERAIALDDLQIDVEELKWIILMVLMNQPGQEAAFAQMEDLVYNKIPTYLH